MKCCPCGAGKVIGDYYNKDNEPNIECDYCEEIYKMKIFLCWDMFKGTYWYQWKATLRE